MKFNNRIEKILEKLNLSYSIENSDNRIFAEMEYYTGAHGYDFVFTVELGSDPNEINEVLPRSVFDYWQEFDAEGHAMHNCVGTYFGRWKAGDAEVAFIRKDGKPYIDMEIGDEGIVQARYKHNKSVDEATSDYRVCEIALAAFKRRAA